MRWLALAILLLVSPAQAGVALQDVGPADSGASGNATYFAASASMAYASMPITAGANLLICLINTDVPGGNPSNTLNSVIWDVGGGSPQTLTQIQATNISSPNGPTTYVYGMLVVGAQIGTTRTITLTFSDATEGATVSCQTYSGVLTTSLALAVPAAHVVVSSTNPQTTVTVTSATNNLVVATAGSASASMTGLTGNLIFSDFAHPANINAWGNWMAGGASVVTGTSSNNRNIIGFDIVAAAGGAAKNNMMMGM